jgi:hypothetical protein
MISRIIHTQWDLARWIKLVLGSGLLIAAIIKGDGLTALLGGFFLFQALMNVSCCGATGCSITTTSNKKLDKEIEYEEIKGDKL